MTANGRSLGWRRGRLLAGALVVAAALGGPTKAGAAISDGVAFPCTDGFAKQVAVDSGFATLAAASNESYEDPRFWVAEQTICADFDGDGSDEMAFALGAMGGTDPWAFFDVPNGSPSGSTFAFPAVRSPGRYPNHRLELIALDGHPAIRDSRRLFRPKDAHCCPTGGMWIRVIAYAGGRYVALRSALRRPPRLHRARLAVGVARNAAAQFLGRRYGEAWHQRAGGRLNCSERLAFNARRCQVGFAIGDLAYFGLVRIALFERARGAQRARIRFRITRLNEYCAFVRHLPPRRCAQTRTGVARLRL